MVDENSNTLNGTRLRAEYLHVAKLVFESTGKQCDPHLSYRLGTMWQCRDRNGNDIAECDARSGQVTQTDDFVLPIPGLLDRVADLRRAGYSSQIIMGFLGHVRARDPLIEAGITFQLAAKVQERLQRLAHQGDTYR